MATLKKIKPVKFYFSNHKKLYSSIKNIFGFYPGNIFLYKLAFRHKSIAEKINGVPISNERLEFLGDAILGSIVADYLFKMYPYKEEGFLTEMRSKIVSRNKLNQLSDKLGLHRLMTYDKDSASLGKSYKGDIFEAFVGALFLDKGFKYTYSIIVNNIIQVHFNLDELEKKEINYKSTLVEWSQQQHNQLEFKVIEQVGKGMKKKYVVQVFIDKKPYAKGLDFSIKGAEKLAAEKTWEMISVKTDKDKA